MQNPVYIIEHLEPKLWPWCLIEYKHISRIVGKDNLWFTNIAAKDSKKLKPSGRVFNNSIKSLPLENVCILDPDSKILLSPEDSKKFKYFLFGGILGDYPPQARTKKELTPFVKGQNVETRNLGKYQLSTDNAVYVTKTILKGIPFEKIKFTKEVEIKINKIESTILPFHYPLINKKPNISRELVRYLKKRED